MLLNLELGKTSRATVWLNELPAASFHSAKVIETKLATPIARNPLRSSAAIELFIVIGPRQMYGLLGGTLVPKPLDTTALTLSIPVGASEDRFQSTIESVGESSMGLPEEYADSITEGIRRELLLHPVTSLLKIECAAYNETSGPLVFDWLADILLLLLLDSKRTWASAELVDLIKRKIRVSRG